MNVEKLIKTGAIEGPYRKTPRPLGRLGWLLWQYRMAAPRGLRGHVRWVRQMVAPAPF